MHRTDAPDSVGGLFSNGNPATGTPGTKVEEAWLNAVQEAICQAIEAAGITLVKGDNTQLADALAVAGYLAAAHVAADGTILAQKGALTLGNFTKSSTGNYWVTISGLTSHGIASATAADAGVAIAKALPSTNTLYVGTFNASGVSTDGEFSIVLFKL